VTDYRYQFDQSVLRARLDALGATLGMRRDGGYSFGLFDRNKELIGLLVDTGEIEGFEARLVAIESMFLVTDAAAENIFVAEVARVLALVSPDCKDGKHHSCFGHSWDNDADVAASCTCPCHYGAGLNA